MSMEICIKKNCTGCGACAYICPKQCIAMREDEIGVLYPVVDSDKCIECGKCVKTCPSNYTFEFLKTKKTYAAWSNDKEERRTSASGGIAAEIYRYAIKNDIAFLGARSNADFSVSMCMSEKDNEYQAFKNSKYVFSSMEKAYFQIEQTLKQKKKVIFIGLPCQNAAVRRVFPNEKQLFLVDLVCHGVVPYSYLKQHIDFLKKKCEKNPKRMSFRDADLGTDTFTFTLYDDNDNCIYAKRTKEWDSYQVAYHRMIAYRENCYNCKYAKPERLTDLTLSDYKGLGTQAIWEGEKNKVSSVLVHTEQGERLMEDLIKNERVIACERPINESVQGDPQLQHPSKKNKSRMDFEFQIRQQSGDFEKAMKVVIRKRKRMESKNKILMFPVRIVHMIKKIVKYCLKK